MTENGKKISIAIDGPSGAGKSTISDKIASEFGFLHLDTGALYRAVGLAVYREGVDPHDADGVRKVAETINVTAMHTPNGQKTLLNGEDVSREIRQNVISGYASAVSALPLVREKLLGIQRQIALDNNVLVDGRDIGTVVLPFADIKIYLTASVESRAQRRYEELILRGEHPDYDTICSEIQARDIADSTREIAPLKCAEDATVLDTSGLSFEDGYALVKNTITERLEKCFIQ